MKKIIKRVKFLFLWWRIPKGPYCHKMRKVIWNKDRSIPPILKTKLCPYWCWDKRYPEEIVGYCKYLECGDYDGPCHGLLFDKVKECGLNLLLSDAEDS